MMLLVYLEAIVDRILLQGYSIRFPEMRPVRRAFAAFHFRKPEDFVSHAYCTVTNCDYLIGDLML